MWQWAKVSTGCLGQVQITSKHMFTGDYSDGQIDIFIGTVLHFFPGTFVQLTWAQDDRLSLD